MVGETTAYRHRAQDGKMRRCCVELPREFSSQV
jgi:hypothetical protein